MSKFKELKKNDLKQGSFSSSDCKLKMKNKKAY